MSLALLSTLALVWMGCTTVANIRFLRRRASPRTEGLPRLSVIIPARNEEANLRRLLPSLLEQRYPGFEVIVVDDASEDDTAGVVERFAGSTVRLVRSAGPPAGWVGKVHALYEGTRTAREPVYLFLDADAELKHPDALAALANRFLGLSSGSVLSGYCHLLGGGLLVVSLVPFALLSVVPWNWAMKLPIESMTAMNGQLWMIDRATYHSLEPHAAYPNEILEDVMIARYLKSRAVPVRLFDTQDEVAVWMYPDLPHAWRGFRKNAYLLFGGRPWISIPLLFCYLVIILAGPLYSLWLLPVMIAVKTLSDRFARFPLRVSALAPVSLTMGALIAADSMWSHLIGRITWKGRRV